MTQIGGAMLAIGPSLVVSLAILVSGSNWEGWRGPGGRGESDETGFAEEWSAEKDAEKNIAWKTPIRGRGLSSPVVWGKRVFLTTAVEGDRVPGAKPPKHKLAGEDFVHPDSTGGDRSHELLVLGIDLESGKVLWESKVYEGKRLTSPNRCTASPVAFNGKILITGEDGVTFVIAAGAEHRVLATNPIGEPVHASLALSQGRILIRGERHLFCVKRAG